MIQVLKGLKTFEEEMKEFETHIGTIAFLWAEELGIDESLSTVRVEFDIYTDEYDYHEEMFFSTDSCSEEEYINNYYVLFYEFSDEIVCYMFKTIASYWGKTIHLVDDNDNRIFSFYPA